MLSSLIYLAANK